MNTLEHLVEDYERQERNAFDFEDIRFAEIYLEDRIRKDVTTRRKALNQRKMKKEQHYD